MEFILEFIIECILELFVEGGMEVGSNKKISKYIRYPILFLLVIFFLGVISLILFIGISIFEESALCSVIIISVAFIILIEVIVKFIKIYNKR